MVLHVCLRFEMVLVFSDGYRRATTAETAYALKTGEREKVVTASGCKVFTFLHSVDPNAFCLYKEILISNLTVCFFCPKHFFVSNLSEA